MLKKIQVLMFFLLGFVFGFREVVNVKMSGYDYSINIEDLCEDGAEDASKNDGDEKGELDLFLDLINTHEFINSLLQRTFHKPGNDQEYTPPFFEIHLPPPELA